MENRPEPPTWTDLDGRVWDAQGRLCDETGSTLSTLSMLCPCCGAYREAGLVFCFRCDSIRESLGRIRDTIDVRLSINLRFLPPKEDCVCGSWEARIGDTRASSFSPESAICELCVLLVRSELHEQTLDPWMSDARRAFLGRVGEIAKSVFGEFGGGESNWSTALKVYCGVSG